MEVNEEMRQVIVTASVRWTWKASGVSWKEDFTCTLDYDSSVKVVSFVVRTDSSANTCVMRAVDPSARVSASSNTKYDDSEASLSLMAVPVSRLVTS